MEDYRLAIQKLKVQIAQLEKENNEAKIKLALPPDEELRIPQFATLLSQNTSQLYIREKVIQEMKKCCDERGMTVEMLFRCADSKFANQVTVQEFKEFLDHFFHRKIDSNILLKVALLFDDDCSGVILKEEFYRVLMYCKCNSENHPYVLNTKAMKIGQQGDDPSKIQQRILQKFVNYVRSIQNTAQGIAAQLDFQLKGFITLDDLVMAFANKGFGGNELFIIMKYFDLKGNNKVKVQDFIYDLKECMNPNKTVEQLLAMRQNNVGLKVLQELRRFRALLAQYKLDPLFVFYQCQPKEVHRKTITDLAITFNRYMKGTKIEQIVEWMRFIDTSGDGAVDLEEFKMAVLVEEDLATFQQYKQEVKEQQDPGLIDILVDKMQKKQISLEQFFDWMDTDQSQTITVMELRKGFIALNIDISYVLKLLKLFDQDQKGIIDIISFYNAFGPEYKEETDKIILKKAVIKISKLFEKNQVDFVAGMKKLLYSFNSSCPVISCEEFLVAMEAIKEKSGLRESEIYKMLEQGAKGQDYINLNSFCNYLYSLL